VAAIVVATALCTAEAALIFSGCGVLSSKFPHNILLCSSFHKTHVAEGPVAHLSQGFPCILICRHQAAHVCVARHVQSLQQQQQ
jgi:hypothetical protein